MFRASRDRHAADAGASYVPVPATAGYPAPDRPAPPKPERLNRNVLTIAAVLMGTVVLAAVVFMQPAKPAAETAPQPPVVTVPRSTFLDEPAQPAGAIGRGDTRASATASGDVALQDSESLAARPEPRRMATAADPYVAASAEYAATPSAADVTGPGGARASTTTPRAAAYAAALAAPVVVSAGRREDAGAGAAASGSSAWSTEGGAIDSAGGQGTSAAATPPGAPSFTGAAPGVVPREGQTRQERWLATAGQPVTTAIRSSVEAAPGPFTLQAGSVIPGTLITEVNSDLPGDIVAQVARDVYDSGTERTLLVPRGARLLGKYDNQIGVGQDRLLVAWTRVIFPDGRSIALPGLPAKDRLGAGGLHDQVDQHKGHVFGTAALLSLITAGAQLAQPSGGYGPLGYPSPGQIAAGAAGQQLSEVAAQLLRRGMDVQPTIRIRAGMPFNVFLNADLTFPGPYTAER